MTTVRARPFAVRQLEDEVALLRIVRGEADDLVRDRNLDPEFLRLVVGARHQRHPGDAGRKAEIVFDPGRGAGLPAEGAAVEHQGGESFRAGIDGGGEACGPGAHDRHVIEAVRIDRPQQADATGQLGLARIAQQLSVRTQHDRQLPGVDVKAIDQRPRLRIGLGIETLMRMAVAAQETLQPQHVAVAGAAHDHRSAGSGLEQADAAQDQRTHDALA
jgi:hypothetical protein